MDYILIVTFEIGLLLFVFYCYWSKILVLILKQWFGSDCTNCWGYWSDLDIQSR